MYLVHVVEVYTHRIQAFWGMYCIKDVLLSILLSRMLQLHPDVFAEPPLYNRELSVHFMLNISSVSAFSHNHLTTRYTPLNSDGSVQVGIKTCVFNS